MTPDEAKVHAYLAEKGLEASSFTKLERRSKKTPDFRVSAGGVFSFYCEVKAIEDDPVLGVRNDPIFNRLTDDIHTATKQFASVNEAHEHPNVLAILNHDDACGFLDLLAVLTGSFFSDTGEATSIYTQYSEGRIKGDKGKIDLFLWLDDFKPSRLLFSQAHAKHHAMLCEWFGVSLDSIRQVGAQQRAQGSKSSPSARLRS